MIEKLGVLSLLQHVSQLTILISSQHYTGTGRYYILKPVSISPYWHRFRIVEKISGSGSLIWWRKYGISDAITAGK